MNVQEALKWVDNLVFVNTGTHLSSLQQEVLTGVWDSRKYREIADRYHCTEANVKRVAGNLWKLVSEELDEKVTKSNFRATMERYYISNFSSLVNFGQSNFVGEGNINLCGEGSSSGETEKKRSPFPNPDIKSEKRHDLTYAPECDRLYNRTEELATLKQWILEENSRIITIFGLSGIGKTALTRQLVEQIKDNFDRLLWRSHKKFPTLNSLTTNLIEYFSPSPETQPLSIIDYLRSHRSLIILDDFQETLTSNELVGTYLPDYQNYGKLLKEIGQIPHNSCLLILSWEQPTELATLTVENPYCHSLQLHGLGKSAEPLLTARGLTDKIKWLELIDLYSGNPLWLNIIASTIQDLFNGSVTQFLSYQPLFLGDIEPLLQSHYQRLSASEKQLIHWFANQDTAADISNQSSESLSDTEALKALQSLRRRALIEKVKDNGTSGFSLQPAIKEYIKRRSPIPPKHIPCSSQTHTLIIPQKKQSVIVVLPTIAI